VNTKPGGKIVVKPDAKPIDAGTPSGEAETSGTVVGPAVSPKTGSGGTIPR